MAEVLINGRAIGSLYPPYIVAEISANHNGSIEKAKAIMLSAKKNGVDAVKLQTYTADTLTIQSNKEDFLIRGGLWDGYTLYDLYSKASTPFEWHKELFDYAHKIQLTCFSTPFDESAVDLLEELNAPAYKIASFEVVDIPLIKYVAATKKPMIISTGMANLEEIKEAVDAARSGGCDQVILLHCISAYPAPVHESNLKTISDLESRFSVVTGLSDHTLGTTVSVASVGMGASFIEKHFTLDRTEKGPDSEFSIEPNELSRLCEDSKIAWQSIGSSGYDRKTSEGSSIKFRRSIYVCENIKKGEILNTQNLRRIRPGYGLAPKFYEELIGQRVTHDIEAGTPMSWELLE